jgi:Fe-S cluster assembly iron-binding protein IscA
MALDEPRCSGDEVFLRHGIHFAIAEELYRHIEPISIDFISSVQGPEFSISSIGYRFSLKSAL